MARGVRRTFCSVCHRPVEEVGALSYRGKCSACAELLAIENARQLRAHSGPFFDHWLARTRAAFGLAEIDKRRDAA